MSAISPVSGLSAALAAARNGLRGAEQRFTTAAQKTAQDPTGDSLIANTVDQIESKTAFAANLKTLHTADQMQKAAIDLKV